MEADVLKQLWREAAADKIIFDQTALTHELRNELALFDKGLKKRDSREIIVAIVLIPVVAAAACFVPGVLAKTGLLLLIPYCLLVIYKLREVKKYKFADFSVSLKEYLHRHKEYLLHERHLLKTIFYWYLLPPMVCMILFFVGTYTSMVKLLLLGAGNILLFVYTYKLNKDAVKNDFDPLIRRIDEQIDELEKEDSA